MTTFEHPAFRPYQDLLSRLLGRTDLAALNEVAQHLGARHAQNGKALRFAALPEVSSAARYEQSIAATGIVPTRELNLHDFLNALVWLRFPQLKSALNLRHCRSLDERPEENRQRGKLRDRLTLLDESGILVASAEPHLLALLRDRKWMELFWEARADVIHRMHFVVIGHGLLEKCLAPFPGMTAKCLFLQTTESTPDALDAFAARAVTDSAMLELPPLPIQGVPGWDNNGKAAYYRDTAVFRPLRTPPRTT